MNDAASPTPEALPPFDMPKRRPLLHIEFWCCVALIALFFAPWINIRASKPPTHPSPAPQASQAIPTQTTQAAQATQAAAIPMTQAAEATTQAAPTQTTQAAQAPATTRAERPPVAGPRVLQPVVQRLAGYQFVTYLRIDPEHVGFSGIWIYLGLLSWLVPLSALAAIVLELIGRPIKWWYIVVGFMPLLLGLGGYYGEAFPQDPKDLVGMFASGWIAAIMVGIVAFVATGVDLIVHLRRLSVGTEADPKYRVGTLQYSLVTMTTMFGWMIWGGFCVDLMEKVFPSLFPLQVKDMGGNNKEVSFLYVFLPNILVFTVVPAISFRSDYTRSRWGRRIPYILISAPFIALFLAALGWSVPIGHAVQKANLHADFYVSTKVVALGLIGLLGTLVTFIGVRTARAGANARKFIPFLVLFGVGVCLAIAAVAYSPVLAAQFQLHNLRGMPTSPAFLSLIVLGVLGACGFAALVHTIRAKWRTSAWDGYLLFALPFVLLLQYLVGNSGNVAAYLRSHNLPGIQHISPLAFSLIFVGVLVVGFQFFHMFVASVNYYLMADVVPQQFLGRYMGYGRILGTVVGVVWSLAIFPLAQNHMAGVYVGAAIVYFVGLTVMCLMVKEGRYPPVTAIGHRTTLPEKFQMYFQECFTHPFFLLFFAANMSTTISNASNFMQIIFKRDTLKMDLATIGRIDAFMGLIPLVLAYPVGSMIDKAHGLRVMMLGILLFIPVSYFGYWILAPGITPAQGMHRYIIYMLLLQIPDMLRDAALIPLMMSLFPRDRYGQFSSANAMLRSTSQLIFPFLAGAFMDIMISRGRDFNYRYIYFWNGTFQVVSLGMYFWLYMYWKRLGGDLGYTPPDTTKKVIAEPITELEKV